MRHPVEKEIWVAREVGEKMDTAYTSGIVQSV